VGLNEHRIIALIRHLIKHYVLKFNFGFAFLKAIPIVILSYQSLNAQCSNQMLIDSILAKAEETSLYSSSVDWMILRNTIQRIALHDSGAFNLKPAMEKLFNELRDHHAVLRDAQTYSIVGGFTDYKNRRHQDTREFPIEQWKAVNDTNLKFSYQLLPDHIGYLKIVGIGPQVDIQEESIRIRKAVETLCKKKVKKWIIDLRYNAGGNIHPMMEGIAPLLGEGKLGSVVNANAEELFTFENHHGNFIYFGVEAVSLKNKTHLKTQPKIAVLTSRWTASSGEIVATAFKGSPKTKFFGESTGGYTTNNNYEIICDQYILCLSTGIYCDRNGQVYPVNITVDEEIPFTINEDPTTDECIQAASKWLQL
jgi:carboxyl-terminal processing protease